MHKRTPFHTFLKAYVKTKVPFLVLRMENDIFKPRLFGKWERTFKSRS